MNFCFSDGRKADAFQRRKRENSPQKQVFGILCSTPLNLKRTQVLEKEVTTAQV